MSTLAVPLPRTARISPIASWRHTAGLVCVFLAMTAAGAYFQLHGRVQTRGSTQSHVPLYLSLFALEYGLFRYVRAGIRGSGVSVGDWSAGTGMIAGKCSGT